MPLRCSGRLSQKLTCWLVCSQIAEAVARLNIVQRTVTLAALSLKPLAAGALSRQQVVIAFLDTCVFLIIVAVSTVIDVCVFAAEEF